MDTGLMISICCMLGSMFAALCRLKHGRNEYIRYAMILLPYGALLYMMTEMHLWSATGHFLQHHLLCSAPVLLFLLGRFMLKCGWKRSLLSCGVYAIVYIFLFALCAPFKDDPVYVWKVLIADSVCDILFIWLLVWLCVRPTGVSTEESLLTAACVSALSDCISVNIAPYIKEFVLGGDLPGVLDLIVAAGWPLIVSGIVFATIMHYVHNRSWKRVIGILLIPMVLTLLYAMLCAFWC